MSDAQIASQPGATWRHMAPPGHAIRPRHPATPYGPQPRGQHALPRPQHALPRPQHALPRPQQDGRSPLPRSRPCGHAAPLYTRASSLSPACSGPLRSCARDLPRGEPCPSPGRCWARERWARPRQGSPARELPRGEVPRASPLRRARPRQGGPKAGRAQGRRRRCPQRLRCEVPTPVRHYLLNLALPPACARAGAQRRARARTRAREGRLRFPGHGREGLQGRRVSAARSDQQGAHGPARVARPSLNRGRSAVTSTGGAAALALWLCAFLLQSVCVCPTSLSVRYIVRVREL